MENRIKECQLDLYADRTSTATMRANQLRLWFASMTYVLLCALRRIGLPHTRPLPTQAAAPSVSEEPRLGLGVDSVGHLGKTLVDALSPAAVESGQPAPFAP
jgi:hypothetical protein